VETALHQLVVRSERALDQQEVALGVFLDIEGAFKNTSHDTKSMALARHGVGHTFVSGSEPPLKDGGLWPRLVTLPEVLLYLKDVRREVFYHPSYGAWWWLSYWQGSVVGCVHAQGYAAGICFLAIGKFPNTVSGLIQWALSTVEEWCGELGLSVNPDKTGLVVFTRKRKVPGFFEPFFGRVVQRSMLVKYLGV
jgi:hypothetical protein